LNPDPPAHRDFPLQLALSGILVLVLAANWLPPAWLWGLNHGIWMPWYLRLGLPIGALLTIWTPAGSWFGSWLTRWLDRRLLGLKPVAYGVVPVLGALAFWFFRDTVHMLGDGQTLGVMVARGDVFHGFDFMTFSLVARIYQALGSEGKPAVFQLFAVVSCLSGAVYLAAAAWSARRLAGAGSTRILLYLLLVLTPSTWIFFGYAEVYAPLSIVLLIFVTNVVGYLRGRASLLSVTVAWSAGLFFHLNALFLAPLLVALLFWHPTEEKGSFPKRLATVVGPALVALVLVGGIFLAGGYDLAQWRRDFGGVGPGSGILVPWFGRNGLLDGRHLKDVLNLLLLLAPVSLALLLTGIPARLKEWNNRPDILLWAGSAWLLVLTMVVHMKLGIVRDWDLFAPHLVLVTMAGWCAVTGKREGSGPGPKVVGSVVAVALALVIPWWGLNAGPDRALARLESVAEDLSPYPRGLIHEQMAYFHQAEGNEDETARNYRRSGEVCPGNPRFSAIYGTYMLNQGDLTEAGAAYDRALAADSTYVYGLQMGVIVRAMQGDHRAVLPMARRLERLGGQHAEHAEAHGIAAEQMRYRSEAIDAYNRAAALDASRTDLLLRVGSLYLQQGDFGSAESIFRRLHAGDPAWMDPAQGLMEAIWQDFLIRPESRPSSENRARLEEAVALMDLVMASPQAGANRVASLMTRRDEIHARLDALPQ